MRYLKVIPLCFLVSASVYLTAATAFCQSAGVTVCNQLDDHVIMAGTAPGCMGSCSTGFSPQDTLSICCNSRYLPEHSCSYFKFGALLATGDFRLHIGRNPDSSDYTWKSCPQGTYADGVYTPELPRSRCVTGQLPHGAHPEMVYTITKANSGV